MTRRSSCRRCRRTPLAAVEHVLELFGRMDLDGVQAAHPADSIRLPPDARRQVQSHRVRGVAKPLSPPPSITDKRRGTGNGLIEYSEFEPLWNQLSVNVDHDTAQRVVAEAYASVCGAPAALLAPSCGAG